MTKCGQKPFEYKSLSKPPKLCCPSLVDIITVENIKSNFAITGCRVGGSGKGQGLQLGWLAGRDGWIVECMGEGVRSSEVVDNRNRKWE